MGRSRNATVGSCVCYGVGCGQVVDVRRDSIGRLYLYCGQCGTLRPGGARFDEYVRENVTMFDDLNGEGEGDVSRGTQGGGNFDGWF